MADQISFCYFVEGRPVITSVILFQIPMSGLRVEDCPKFGDKPRLLAAIVADGSNSFEQFLESHPVTISTKSF